MTGDDRVVLEDHADLARIVAAEYGQDPAGSLFLVPFTPDASLIGHIRVRVPDPPQPAATVRAVATACWELLKPDWDETHMVAIIAWGPAEAADPPIALAYRTLKQTVGIRVFDVIRVHDGRCWSYKCDEDGHGQFDAGLPIDPPAGSSEEVIGGTTPPAT